MRTFNHFGVVTDEKKEGAFFNEGLKVWLTDFNSSPNKIEFLKFEEGSCMPELVQKKGHIPYTVPSLEEEMVDTSVEEKEDLSAYTSDESASTSLGALLKGLKL